MEALCLDSHLRRGMKALCLESHLRRGKITTLDVFSEYIGKLSVTWRMD